MQEKSKVIFFDRDTLFPPPPPKESIDQDDEDDDEDSSSTFRLPSPFAIGVQITLTFFARCIQISLVDVDANDFQAEMEAFRQAKKNSSMIFVNACNAPTLGALVAAVPRPDSVSSSTLLQPSSASMVMMGGLATSISGASESSSAQELLAKSVGERLIMRDKRNNNKNVTKNASEFSSNISDKMILVSCGLGIGAGMNPKEGGDFLGMSLSNPMLPAGIVNAIFEMCA